MALPREWRPGGNKRTYESGQAWVYEVESQDRAGVYALKRLKNPRRRERFIREVETMLTLRERGADVVLEVVAADLDGEHPYFVTPWCDEPLEAAVNDGRYRNDPLSAISVLTELAEAVSLLNQHEVAHRDLKPANVLLDGGRVFLADLGLALNVDPDAERLTETEEAVGSRLYIAPENEGGINEAVDQRPADFYAFGKIIWAVLAGRQPPPRELHRERGNRVSDLLGERYEPINALIGRLANADPRARLANWSVVVGELETFRRYLAGEAPFTAGSDFDLQRAVELAHAIPDLPTFRATTTVREETETVKWWLIQTAGAMFEAASAVAGVALSELTTATQQMYMFSITTAGIHPRELVEAGAPLQIPPGSVDRADDVTRRSILFINGHSPIGADVPELDLATYLSLDGDEAWLFRVAFLRIYSPPDRLQQFVFPRPLVERSWRVAGPYPIGLAQTTAAAAAFAGETAHMFLELAGRMLDLLVRDRSATDDEAWEE